MRMSSVRTAIPHSGNVKIMKTVMNALRQAKITPSHKPQTFCLRIRMPARSCSAPAISRNQPHAVRSMPRSTSVALAATVSSSLSAAIPLRAL